MKQLLQWAMGLLLVFGSVQQAGAQERLPEYVQAEKFTDAKLKTMLFSTELDPHWFQKGNAFWYAYKTSDGLFWYVVEPSSKKKTALFDRDELAAELTTIVKDPFDARHLPIKNLKAEADGNTFTFEVTSTQDAKPAATDTTKVSKKEKSKEKPKKQVFYFSYDFKNRKLTHLEDKTEDYKEKTWANFSPDGQTILYAKDLNLYRMSREDYEKAKKDEKDSTIVEIQITTDGLEDFGWGIPYSTLNTDTICNGKRKRVWGAWSPDSKHFVTVITDNRAVKNLWVINSAATPRPTLETYRYQMPGEKEAPIDYLTLIDLNNNSKKVINTSAFKDQMLDIEWTSRPQKERDKEDHSLLWLGDNNMFYMTRSSRDLYRIDLCSYTIGEDTVVPIIKERMNTYQNHKQVFLANGGKNLIQWSERNGWAHLYLYDNKGNLLNPITKGPWHVEEVVKVEDNTVYFLANGMNPDENPYYEHLYKININGTGLKALTQEDYFHKIAIDDDAQFIVDNYSRVNTVPCTVVLNKEGKEVMKLEESDFSQLFAAGYKFPEIFKVKAADGVTDLYGVMYKPFNFDSTKVYPIVDYVYPGPQVEATYYPFTRMSIRTDRLAQAGFIVISVGQRGGHPSRSKWYHNYGYGNMRDYPLADHKYAVEQLAERYPYIDITKVGMHGHSGGGFMSTAAILQYPDFYKVAVSCAGNHDNNIYNREWSETHHGVKETVSEKGDTTFVYKIATNPALAAKLKGHLLLVHGEIDNNVHPANTMRVVNALINAGKRFDMLILPRQRHGFGDMNEYFYWRLVDYFSLYLKGNSETSVDIPRR